MSITDPWLLEKLKAQELTQGYAKVYAPPTSYIPPIQFPARLKIKFKKLYPDAVPPFRKHPGDAAFDLTVYKILPWGDGKLLFTSGIAVEIPPGHFGLIRPRSSLSDTQYVVGTSGVIDSSYRGELKFCFKEVCKGSLYGLGDRFCQLLILPLPEVEYVEVEELSPTTRGEGGFGSTGQ